MAEIKYDKIGDSTLNVNNYSIVNETYACSRLEAAETRGYLPR